MKNVFQPTDNSEHAMKTEGETAEERAELANKAELHWVAHLLDVNFDLLMEILVPNDEQNGWSVGEIAIKNLAFPINR